jgi:NodT family efflux transporter outer membrane factor (OMF) lipoprotein
MRKTCFALAAAQVLALAGCASAPPYETPKMAVPDQYKETGPWQLAKPSDQMLRGDWWKLLNDPVLDGLEERINVSNQDLASAFARYNASKAIEAETDSAMYPTVQGLAGITRNRQSDDRPLRGSHQPDYYWANTIGFSASYELDLWGRVNSLVTAGTAATQASAADLESVRLALHANLASEYLTLRGLDAELQLLKDTVEAYRRQLTLIQNRFQGGIASAQQVARAQTQLQEAQTKVADIVAQRAVIEHAIAVLVGEPASTFSISGATAPIAQPEIPLGLPSTLLQRRPDIAAAERRVAETNAEVGIARAAFFPNIILGLQGGFQNTGGLNLLSLPNSFWSIGPAAVMTLFDAGRRKAEVERAKARTDEAAAQYRATVLRAFKEVEDNLALLRQLRDEQSTEQAAVASAEKSLELAMNRYREGVVSYLEVIDAEEAVLRTKRTSLDIATRSLQASVGLIRAIGGGWTGPALAEPSTASGVEGKRG